MKLKKNQLIEIEITGVTTEGAGIGKYDGMAVFVPLTAPGDTTLVKIVKVSKSYAYGRLEKLLTASPHRIQPDCPHFTQCGGCCYRHISYEAELHLKTTRVQDALTRIGGFQNLPIRPIIAADSRNSYRNKAMLPLGCDKEGSLTMGFYAINSHRIVDCQSCLLHPKEFNDAMKVFREWSEKYGDNVYDEESHTGRMRRLYLRMGEMSKDVMACVVVNANGLHHEQELANMLKEAVPGLTSVIINSNRNKTNVVLGKKCRTSWGADFIEDTLCGLKFQISPLSFYQVNRTQAQRLYEKAAEYAALTGSEILLDLYCGTGTIGLSMAKNAKKLIGVEIIEQAVENARQNALNNGIENAEFLCSDAARAAHTLTLSGQLPDVVILDPPRKGCSPDLVETVAAMCPKRIVYISCDPATLARDLKQFAALGYPPTEATPADLFPATAHVETCVLLSHKNS